MGFLTRLVLAALGLWLASELVPGLHVEGGWTLVAYVFTGVIVLITILGSLWIMYHLNTNMMPGMMTGEVSNTP